MSVPVAPDQEAQTVLEWALPGRSGDLTVGITDNDGNTVVAQSGTGIFEIDAPSGFYRRSPGLIAPENVGRYFIIWELSGDFYADEELIVSDVESLIGDEPVQTVRLRSRHFLPGQAVKLWERDKIAGPHPPPAEPRNPLRTDLVIDVDGEVDIPNLPLRTSYLLGATINGEFRWIDFETSEPTAIDIEAQIIRLSQLVGAESNERISADADEVTARADADTAEQADREAADAALQAAIDTEVADREADVATLVAKDSLFTDVTDHGLIGNGTADELAAWNAMVDQINVNGFGTYQAIYFPPGAYSFSAVPKAITAGNVFIFGAGPASKLKFASSAAHGTFFTIGDSSHSPDRIVIRDLFLQFNQTTNPPPAGEKAFHLVRCTNVYVRNIHLDRPGGLCQIGTATSYAGSYDDRASIYAFTDIVGVWNAETFQPSRIHIINGADGRFTNVRMVSTELNNGYGIHADACPRGVDQHFFDTVQVWGMGSQSQSSGHGTSHVGIQRNVWIDFTNGNVINWNFRECVLDESVAAAVRISADSGAHSCTDIHFFDCHFATNDGRGIFIVNSGTGEVRSIQVIGGRIRYRDKAAVECQGAVTSLLVQGTSMLHDDYGYDSGNTGRESIVHSYAHGRVADDQVVFIGTPPAPLVAGTTYYVKNADANGDGKEFTLAATAGGATINITDPGSAGFYFVVVEATVRLIDTTGFRVLGCYMGPFSGAVTKTNYAVEGSGGVDLYVVAHNVARAMLTSFSNGLATAGTNTVLTNNAH